MRLSPSYPVLTRRLSLQPLTVDDIDELLTYRARADVCRYLPFDPMTREILERRLTSDMSATELTDEGQALPLGVRLRSSGRLVGDVVLFLTSVEHAGGEVGYVFSPDVAGLGYATEAVTELVSLAFSDLGLHRVIARLDPRNGPSARLAGRLGMRQEAHFVQAQLLKGEWCDTLVFAVLDEEWRLRHDRASE